jgi:Tfp pilus assembly protein PilV
MMRQSQGLTLIEAIIAVTILAVIITAFAGVVVTSIRQNALSGGRAAAVQLSNFLGGRALEGDTAVLPSSGTTTRTWAYKSLATSFSELTEKRQFANSDLYRAEVSSQGTPAWASAKGLALRSYRINVCWESPEGESCVQVETVGPEPSAGGSTPPLAGLN